MAGLVHHAAGRVKAKDVCRDTAGSPRAHLVLVAKDERAAFPAPVIEAAMGQHSKQRALAGIDIPHACHADIDEVVLCSVPPDKVVGDLPSVNHVSPRPELRHVSIAVLGQSPKRQYALP